jgi:hypothetical protein
VGQQYFDANPDPTFPFVADPDPDTELPPRFTHVKKKKQCQLSLILLFTFSVKSVIVLNIWLKLI